MDLLNAINQVLPKLGEHPVTSVDAKHPTVAIILQNLLAEIDDTLLSGWWFNTTRSTLYAGSEGYIDLPVNTLSVRTLDPTVMGVQRGRQLYNITDRTFKWPTTQGVKVELRERLDFENLPESVARFVLYSSLVTSYLTDIGLEQVVREWQQMAGFARKMMESEHLENMRFSTARSPRYRRIRRAIGGH